MNTISRLTASKAGAITVVAVSTFLLLSMGGAVLAAPLTIPLLDVIARSRVGWLRTAAVVVAALTAAEVAWAITYVTVGEAEPWIWALPVVVGLGASAFLLAPDQRRSPSPST